MTEAPDCKRMRLEAEGAVAVLTLASDKVNAIDLDVLDELVACIDYCERDPGVEALVLTGEGAVFSAGVNVSTLLASDKEYTARLLEGLRRAFVRVFATPLPTVGAVNGSAIAGGCLLACAFDKRLIADEARIGVTELKVGVSFPVMAVELLRHVCGRRAEALMFDAGLLSAEQACEVGLAHGRVSRAELLPAAVRAAAQLASVDRTGYALAKATSRRAALAAMEDAQAGRFDALILDHWQSDATRSKLGELLKPKE